MKVVFRSLLILSLMAIAAGPAVFAQGGTTPIDPSNAASVVELQRLGRGSAEFVEFAPDGTIVLGGTIGGWLYSADALDTAEEPPLLSASDELTSMDLSDDGSVLALGESGTIRLYDVANQSELSVIETNGSSGAIAISPDGSVLVTTGSGFGSLEVFNLADGMSLGVLEGHSSSIESLDFNSDGSVLASAAGDSTVRLWDVAGLTEIAVLEGHSSTVNDVAFSPDDSVLASGANDDTVRIWDVAGAAELAVIEDTENTLPDVTALQFTPDGANLGTGHNDGSIRNWDVAALSLLGTIESNSFTAIRDLSINADGTQFVVTTNDNVAILYDLASGAPVATTVAHSASVDSVDFTPDSATLVVGGTGTGGAWLYDATALGEINTGIFVEDVMGIGSGNEINAAFSPDGSLLATAGSFDVNIVDVASGEVLQVFEGDGLPSSVTWSPDGALVAFSDSDGAYIYDTIAGTRLATLTTFNDWATSIAFSPDGTLLAVTADDHTVRLFGLP